jgi:hypothetical protein
MAKPLVVAAILSLTLANSFALPPKGFSLRSSEQSPSGDMLVQEYEHHDPDGTHVVQIWLTSAGHPDDAALLFEHRRAADIVFSPDESRVAVNHHASSTDGVVEVFERASGVHYKKIISADTVREKTLAAFHRSVEDRTGREFDHLYADCVLWAADSSAFLVRLHGHESGIASLQNYCCVFRIADQGISFDLALFDRNSSVEHHK